MVEKVQTQNTVGLVRDVDNPGKTVEGKLPEEGGATETVGHVRTPA